MKKRLLSTLLALNMLAVLLLTLQISANAASNSNYSLTGNYVDDVIQVATAQKGKTWNDLGSEMIAASNGKSYKGNWCGNFIWWCGYKAGLVSNGFYPSDNYFASAVNPALWFLKSGNGKAYVYTDYYNQLLGRTEEGWRNYADVGLIESVDKSFAPQKGDIIIYGKPQSGKTRVTITHTGYIRQNSSNGKIYTVEGNTGSGSGVVKFRDITANYYESTFLGYPIAYVRPNYPLSIANGMYTLTPQCAPNARLDVTSGSLKNSANIQIYQSNDTAAQQFEFTYMGDGYYTITAKVSGKLLNIQGGASTSGANVCQSDSNASDSQKWKLESAGDGWYYIVPKLNSALCLDVDSAGSANGTNVQVWSKNQTNAQRWKLTSPTGILPSNLSVSTDKSSYSFGESVKITPSANNATHYAISVWRGAFKTGERLYANFNLSGGISFDPPQPGTYTIRADAKNTAGYISVEKTFTVTATNTTPNSGGGHWGSWSEWSANYVGETSTRQVESREIKVSDAYTEYRYGRFVDSTGTKVCWCKKYLESWSSVTGSASLQYSDWSTTRYSENGKIWGCGFCGGEHIGVNYVSADGRAWWSQYELPEGYYYWEEIRTSEAKYETQYRYRDWITG